ncbi:MAG: hypothetical protein R3C03_07690 [Pirellulaceae bacterium]
MWIATLTSRFARLIQGTNARLYDTRKTTPGWRRLEKYAVVCGGGHNHRMGLHDAILIKDNHLAMLQNANPNVEDIVGLALTRAKAWIVEHADELPFGTETRIQIEVDRLEQLDRALPHAPHMILLDNMKPDLLAEAVARRDQVNSAIELEASGGVNLDTIRAIAETGVERISVGAVTHSATNFDIGLDWSLA